MLQPANLHYQPARCWEIVRVVCLMGLIAVPRQDSAPPWIYMHPTEPAASTRSWHLQVPGPVHAHLDESGAAQHRVLGYLAGA